MKSQDRKEEKLLNELEAMYHRVAESEKPEIDREQMEVLQSHYQTLQVSPDASMETIKNAYKQMVDFWDPGHFPDNNYLREKAERKLTEITHAYGKILAFRQMENGLPSAIPPIQIYRDPDLSDFDEEKGHHLPWGKILLGGAAFVIVVSAVFFWPGLYHYDTIPSGNKISQVGTNRITGSMTDPDGGKWNHPQIPAANLPALPLPAQRPEPSAKQTVPTPQTKPGPAEGPNGDKREPPSEKPASQPAKAKGYAIQISAMRDLNLAKEFVERQKKSGQRVYLAKIEIKDRGVWYIVYIGRFADKAQAARYMEEKKIKEFFPECFIQKLS